MDLLFNTIMLEPNRWTADHVLTRPLVELLEPISAAGFQDLELWGYHLDRAASAEIEALGEALAARSLRAVAVGAYPSFHLHGLQDEAEVERLERLAVTSARLGAKIFKIFPGRVASADADRVIWDRTVERLRALATRVVSDGMVLTLETHGGTLCDNLDSTLRLLDALDGLDNVGICFQPYTGHDTTAAICTYDALVDWVLHLHVQNRGQDRTMSLLRDGEWTDYGRFLTHVCGTGFDGALCIEFTADIVPPEGSAFDLDRVLANAVLDRHFIESTIAPST